MMAVAGWAVLAAANPTEVKVSDFGYDATDATEIIQKALDSGASRVIVDAAKGPWTVRPLFVRSNTEVVFEEGAQLLAKPGEFMPRKSALVSVVCATNVTLRGLGKGATLRMRITDYQNPPYKKGEWRHALNIKSSKNVLVENLLLADSGGDGVYLGVEKSRCPCENITIRKCVCDNNNRQGISVISAKHLLIEDTVMKNTRGTNPKAGIDFEPNNASEVLIDCVMRNCLTTGNDGAGYDMYLGQLTSATEPVSITFENCRSVGDRRSPLVASFNPLRHGRGVPMGGFLKVKGCTFQDSPSPAVSITDKPAGAMDVSFEDCVFANCSTSNPSGPDVHLGLRGRSSPLTDGISFHNVTIKRSAKGEWFSSFKQPWRAETAKAITGEVTVSVDGTTEKIVLDDAWRRNHLANEGAVQCVLDDVPFDPARVQVVDTAPGARVKLTPLLVRDECDVLVYAAQPGPITFAAKFVKVNRKREVGKNVRLLVQDMSGKKIKYLPLPGPKTSDCTFKAPRAGFYRISCAFKTHGIVFSECDAPFALRSSGKGLDIFRSQGPAYFAHAAGSDITLFCGGGGGERVTVKLSDPDGKEVRTWENIGKWGFHRIAPDTPTGLWSVTLSRPAKGFAWEDSFLDLTGTPAVFFLSKEKYWLPK